MKFYDFAHLKDIARGSWINAPAKDQMIPRGVVIDTRENVAGKVFVAIRGERFDGHAFLREAADGGAAMLLVDRPTEGQVPHDTPTLLVDDSREALGEIAAAHRRDELARTNVIAITGSCGKTTTKSLVHAVLSTTLRGTAAERSFNNDIGVPLTLLAATADDDYVVVEIGTNAPGEIAELSRIALPDIAIITMIGEAHLGGFGSAAAIRDEKLSILRHVRPGGVGLLNANIEINDTSAEMNILRFGRSESANVALRERHWDGEYNHLALHDGSEWRVPLPGEHNAINTLAAIAVGLRLGCAAQSIQQGLSTIAAPAMRFECSGTHSGVHVFNDAYNANPQSMRASIDTFCEVAADADRRICILGDMLELGDESITRHATLLRWIDDKHADCLDRVLLIGKEFREAMRHMKIDTDHMRWMGMACDLAICNEIRAMVGPGDAVLLKGSRSMALEQIATFLNEPEVSGVT